MQKYLILLAGVLIAGAFLFGCEDRGIGGTPVDMGNLENWGVSPISGHVFPYAMTLQLRNNTEQLLNTMYIPPEAYETEPQPLPLLVLLAPETGDRYYYFQAGLLELVRELTASGQIKPMIIYCMANDQTFGGYFYGDSDPAGRYDAIFHYDLGEDVAGQSVDSTNNLLRFVHSAVKATIRSSAKRGIGGIGQGAYGAFRAAIKNPGVYSSISVADGPLDFDGGAAGGLTGLFDDALAEQKDYYYNVDPLVDTTISDTVFAGYDIMHVDTTYVGGSPTPDTTWINWDTIPFDYYRDFDTAQTMPLSMMFMGGSYAFSPNDTLVTYTRSIVSVGGVPIRVNLTNIVQYQMNADSTTLITTLVKADSYSHNLDMDFHLPFDSNGTLYAPIWDRWMRNNLQDMYEARGGNPLGGARIWFGTNPNARWNYYQMTQSWLSFVRSRVGEGNVEVYPYSSYDDDPVIHDEYLFDLLREMLIFHSNNFYPQTAAE
jgi:hypothetical protein